MEQMALTVGDIITLTGWMAGIVMLILFVLLIQELLQSEHCAPEPSHHLPAAQFSRAPG